MKKILALVLVLSMVLGSFGFAFANEEAAGMERVVEAGAFGVGGLRLQDVATRAELATIVLRLNGFTDEEILALDEASNYEDVPAGHWAAPFVGLATKEGLFQGYGNGFFGPADNANYAQLLTVMLRALGYGDDLADLAWPNGFLVKAAAVGIPVDFSIDPLTEAKRELVGKTMELTLDAEMKGGEMTLGQKLGIVEYEEPVEEPEVPTALEVVDVYATNLKQVVVVFNQPVDEDTATAKANYELELEVGDVELLNDTTVVVTLKEQTGTTFDGYTNKFENQEEYELTVKNVESAKGVKIAETDLEFTPLDVTLPTVTEVNALGTKALQIFFSEPVFTGEARSTTSYKVDGKNISGSVQYVYPNEVIIITNLTVGEHTLDVSRVRDFMGFAVSEKNIPFTVVEDTTAPQIVNIKATDLTKAVIEFDEPVRYYGKIYHTVDTSQNGVEAGHELKSNKIEVTFKSPLPVNGGTVYVKNVEDYSGNKADRSFTVVPDIDTTRPEITEVKVKEDGANHKIEIKFSKTVTLADVQTRANFEIKDKDGKLVSGTGLNKGVPVRIPTLSDDKKTVTILLAGLLEEGTYEINVSGIRDNAHIKNTMLPYVATFEVGDTDEFKITNAWYEISDNKREASVYVRFNKDFATSGNGNALQLTKYNYSPNADGSGLKPFPTDATITDVSSDTVRIRLPRLAANTAAGDLYASAQFGSVRVSLVSDNNDNFVGKANLNQTVEIKAKTALTIDTVWARAIEKNLLRVEFAGVLTNVDARDFTVDSKPLEIEKITTTSTKTTVEFSFTHKDDRFDALAVGNFRVLDASSQDAHGNKVANKTIAVEDRIAPEVDEDATNYFKLRDNVLSITFDENVRVDAALLSALKSAFTIEIREESVTVTNITYTANVLEIELDLAAYQLKEGRILDTDLITVELKAANETFKGLTDTSARKNAVKAFNLGDSVGDIANTATMDYINALPAK